jgi:hypothetical protein
VLRTLASDTHPAPSDLPTIALRDGGSTSTTLWISNFAFGIFNFEFQIFTAHTFPLPRDSANANCSLNATVKDLP